MLRVAVRGWTESYRWKNDTEDVYAQEGRKPPSIRDKNLYLSSTRSLANVTWKYCLFKRLGKTIRRFYESKVVGAGFCSFFRWKANDAPKRWKKRRNSVDDFVARGCCASPAQKNQSSSSAAREIFLRRRPLTLDVTPRVNTAWNPACGGIFIYSRLCPAVRHH